MQTNGVHDIPMYPVEDAVRAGGLSVEDGGSDEVPFYDFMMLEGDEADFAAATLPYKAYHRYNFRQLPQVGGLSEAQRQAIDVVAQVLPFRTNSYVVEHLIDWENIPDDPIFQLTFPQQEMLRSHHFGRVADLLRQKAGVKELKAAANAIRAELNPHPAGQLEHNRPYWQGRQLNGLQHKYKETVLFFPRQGQTCHAYCTFCFRWPQFVGNKSLKLAMQEGETLAGYIQEHPEVTDVLITGGDPLIMKSTTLRHYMSYLLRPELTHLQTIRLGSKALSFWPYRFLTDPDADELLRLFETITASGKHLTLMAHFNHPRELENEIVAAAIQRILRTGAHIRTQSPVLAHINDQPHLWVEMWQRQVALGLIPYYMFVARDTGAQHYFAVPLNRTWEIFQQAYQNVSGIGRTVRGPSMSAHPGKVQILGTSVIQGEKVFVLQFLQAREPDWVLRPFLARFDPEAIWLDELKPAFGESQFFFERA
jgi:KamA family protein